MMVVMCFDVGGGGARKNVLETIVDVLKKTDKKILFLIKRNARIKETEANTTLIMFQNVLKKFFLLSTPI